MEREYADYVTALQAAAPSLAVAVASFHGMEDVLQWMKRRGLTKAAVDLVGMDEFSYDFMIQLEPDGQWLVFSVT